MGTSEERNSEGEENGDDDETPDEKESMQSTGSYQSRMTKILYLKALQIALGVGKIIIMYGTVHLWMIVHRAQDIKKTYIMVI
jgi:hypothetical protein